MPITMRLAITCGARQTAITGIIVEVVDTDKKEGASFEAPSV